LQLIKLLNRQNQLVIVSNARRITRASDETSEICAISR
jgi:hypothetical protein